ncbi:quaternary ammonium compound efflux SMR transporter SugE [Melghirimyces algeriensis]|uniref:Quaternary ammonium compound-resistance protein SugE n=1 Tax=Melghirimyces algeriensis TaxID=910412 RepID=A0A521F124_9BACL|nr:quaternary ammonium compound efflux SMR transporter SugE [Melghirimyces algeriensis]SMO89776.1 quaternary ammonium compound-resistance protein SugE [Melghirimyces algeriensis]
MAWVILVIAGIFETVWAVGLKYTQGFTRLVPSLITVAAMWISFWLLSTSLKSLPVGTAYAIWTGIGTLGAVLFGIFFLGEPRDWTRLLFIALLLFSLIGLKLTSSH